MISRIGIIGDVHTEADALEQALAFLGDQSLDALVCMGDLVDGHGDEFDVDRCCELLQEAQVPTICGNHDRWLLDGAMRDLSDASLKDELEPSSLAFLRELPPTLDLETVWGPVQVCHGLGMDDMGLVLPHDQGHELNNNASLQELIEAGKYRLVLNGHSHRRMVRYVDPLWIVNAGTLHRDFDPCVGVIDLAANTVDYYTPAGQPLEQFALSG